MISLEQRQEFFDYMNERLSSDFTPDKSRCIASVEDGKILGAVIFDRFTKYGCELSIASDHPRFLTRNFIHVTCYYAFVTCGKIRITTLVKEHNKRSIKLTKGIGFIHEATLKQAYGDQDAILFRMLKDECKWLPAATAKLGG